MYKILVKVVKQPEHRYVKCCYNMLKQYNDYGKFIWATCIEKCIDVSWVQ